MANACLYETAYTQLTVSQNPLSKHSVNITLKQSFDDKIFFDIWKTRFIAERHLANNGYENRLCYLKLENNIPLTWHLTSYESIPRYLNNILFRKIYSIWVQAKVLFRTVFPSLTFFFANDLKKEKLFWKSLISKRDDKLDKKTGKGPLTEDNVIQKQIIYPSSSFNDSQIFVLYNYAPLQTGREQMHFLLVPNPNRPAKNFLELDNEQYIEILLLTKKINLWAMKEFKQKAIIHFLDKTGEIAGQTQPIYHAHLVIITQKKEEIWGKISMFFRMLFPTRPLPDKELNKRVEYYRNTLGAFLKNF